MAEVEFRTSDALSEGSHGPSTTGPSRLSVLSSVMSSNRRSDESVWFDFSQIINDREIGRSRGFDFVTFKDEKSMRDAIEGMNGLILTVGASPSTRLSLAKVVAAATEVVEAAVEAKVEAAVKEVATTAVVVMAVVVMVVAYGDGGDGGYRYLRGGCGDGNWRN
ncbi:Glycine-rich RNA-binding protein [Actinidia chinensis var. chinensis]|uniref:Glycine-rich RNA-binding protein n=1 Tax=Actinidia chinensis var. chinensis TaxID=1590841 RepID=A0A2R6QHE7_ACTCC|nr:Glycine-rich RNA-binding protein [Actinidia chinensis var. chinensis]